MTKPFDLQRTKWPNILWLEGKLRIVHHTQLYSMLSTFVHELCITIPQSSHLSNGPDAATL